MVFLPWEASRDRIAKPWLKCVLFEKSGNTGAPQCNKRKWDLNSDIKPSCKELVRKPMGQTKKHIQWMHSRFLLRYSCSPSKTQHNLNVILNQMFGALEPPILHAWFLLALISQVLLVKCQRAYFQTQLISHVVIFTSKHLHLHQPGIFYRWILGKSISVRVKVAFVALFNKKKYF